MKQFNNFCTLKKATAIITCLWVLIQIVVVYIFWDFRQGPDAAHYIQEALSHVGELYPSQIDMNDSYIQAPGMVNYLILVRTLFFSVKAGIILNILMNIGIVYEIYYLGKRFFSETTACISVILFCLIPTNLFAPIHQLTEIPFLFFSLLAFILSIQKKYYWIILAGLLYAYTYTIRPQVLAFCVVSVIYALTNKVSYKYYFCLLIPYLLLINGIGYYNKVKTGYMITTSSTGGQNLLMSTAEEAPVTSFDGKILYDKKYGLSHELLDTMTFAQRDSVWRAKGREQLFAHPVRYISLVIRKIPYLYAAECWSLPFNFQDLQYVLAQPNPERGVIMRRVYQMLWSIPYFIIMLIFFISCFKNRKQIFSQKGLFLLLLAIGTLGSCLFTIEVRYHYPWLIAIVLWAAYGISSYSKNKSLRATTHLS